MAQEQNQNSPLIDPEKVKTVVQPEQTQVPQSQQQNQRQKPTAAELGPKQYCWGTGRRKSSVARVRIRPGSGKIQINGRELEKYFPNIRDVNSVRAPLITTERIDQYDVWINVKGGGTTGQAGACLLGIARALCQADPETFPALRDADFLTRDSRKVERKKYGKRGARRSYQFSKR